MIGDVLVSKVVGLAGQEREGVHPLVLVVLDLVVALDGPVIENVVEVDRVSVVGAVKLPAREGPLEARGQPLILEDIIDHPAGAIGMCAVIVGSPLDALVPIARDNRKGLPLPAEAVS